MKAVLYRKSSKVVISIVTNVFGVGADYIKGDSEVNGINTATLSYVVIENNIPITLGQVLPEGLRDYSANFFIVTPEEKMAQLEDVQTVLSLAVMELAEAQFGGV